MAWESLHTEKEISLGHLGITATHVRKIRSGEEYDKYFDRATGTTELINDNATVHDTLEFVAVLVNKTLTDTAKIAQVLKRPTLEATCKAVFDFFYQHYQYKLDDIGIEQVRRPSRAWADRKTGIDCDCFTTSVSSVLTNLGIAHYLKIIAINGRENFQHIYVVVPKSNGLDINAKSNYWIIDPVLNNFNEEAPKITKTKHLKMNGIPLQQLNGIDGLAGLGNEFNGLEDELNGLDDDSLGRAFNRRLKAHVSNTRRKIEADPQAVAQMYRPDVLVSQLRTLEGAFDGTEEHLESVLEGLAATEHEAMQPALAGMYDDLHGHDDELYGALFGDLDDRMLDSVTGLGKKGGNRAAKRQEKKAEKKAKKAAGKAPGKKGFFTKVKNAKKAIKSGKLKGKLKAGLKKVVRVLKKTNPLAMAARGGFIMAMRTNFAKIAEKAYWGYQSLADAKKAGLTEEYYNSCVELLKKIVRVFVDKLGGDEGTIKKPIMNGRAAKKIAKSAKKRGMAGSTEELFGLGGFGVVTAAASATTITAAMAFLTPLIAFIKKAFKGKKAGTVQNENGTESEEPSENAAEEMDNTSAEASNPSDTTYDNDGSIENADAANNESSSDDEGQKKNSRRGLTPDEKAEYNKIESSQGKEAAEQYAEEVTENATDDTGVKAGQGRGGSSTGTSGGSKTGLIVGGLALTALAAGLALKGSKKKPAPVNGLGAAKKPAAKKAKAKSKSNKVKTIKL